MAAHEGIVYEVRAYLNVGVSEQWSGVVADFTAGRSGEPLRLVLGRASPVRSVDPQRSMRLPATVVLRASSVCRNRFMSACRVNR